MAYQNPQEYTATNIPAALATTTVASFSTATQAAYGLLHTITINTKGATGNTLTVYDNTAASGKIIALIDTTASTGTFIFDAICTIGITVISATGTGADVTVNWRKSYQG